MFDKTKLNILFFHYQSSVIEAERYFYNFKNTTIIKFHQPLIQGCSATEIFEYKNNKLLKKRNLGYSGRFLLPLVKRFKLTYLFVDFIITLQCIYAGISSLAKKYDICISLHLTQALGVLALKKLGIVKHSILYITDYYVIQNKNSSFVDKLINVFYKILLQWIIRTCDAVWLISPYMLKAPYLARILHETNKPTHAFETAGCDVLSPDLVLKLGSKEDYCQDKRIGFLGNLGPHHGLELVIDILPEIIKVIPEMKLDIIGSGPEEDKLRSLVKTKDIEKNVIFRGHVGNRNEAYRLLSKCSIGLATYKPQAEFEMNYYLDPGKVRMYMSVGLPVIITRGPYFAEVIKKNQAGFVIDYASNKLQDILVKFLQDEEMIEEYHRNMAKLSKQYRCDLLMEKAMQYTMEKFYYNG